MSAKLSARGVSVGYEGRLVLEGIDLDLFGGEIVALVGPNGVGKTTLLRTLCGAAAPLSGSVACCGAALAGLDAKSRARKIARVDQDARADWGFSVRETVAMGRFAYRGWFAPAGGRDARIVEDALERTGLGDFGDRPVTELSGGELQRVMVARALAQEPEILLLDEPVSHLDVKHQIAILDLIRSLADGGLAVAASLHDLNLAGQYADRIALFAENRMLAVGAPQAILQEELLRRAFDASVLVGSHPTDEDSPYVYHPASRRRSAEEAEER